MIQSLWIGEKLSIMERLAISSFLQNGHAFHLYVYDEVEGVPQGTILRDANEIIPAEKIFKYKHHDTCAGFADLFRYKLLLERGGYWVDTDVVCLRPFAFSADHMFAKVRSSRRRILLSGKRYHITNWFIKAPIGSQIMDYCYREAARGNPEQLVFGQTGPRLMTAAVEKFGVQEYVAPLDIFCPIYASQWRQLISGSCIAEWKWRKAMRSSYAVHLYHEMWRRNDIDTNAVFPRQSIYEQVKRRYLN